VDHENGFDDDGDEFVTINKNNSPLMASAPSPSQSPSTATDSSSSLYYSDSVASFDHFSSGGSLNILEINVKHNDYADEEAESQQAAAAIKAAGDGDDGYSSLDAQYISDFVLSKEANNVVPVEEESFLKRRLSDDDDEDEEEENRTAPYDDEDEIGVSRPASKRQKFSSEIDINRKWCQQQQQHENENQRSDDDARFHNLTNVTDHKTRRHFQKNSVSSFYDDSCDGDSSSHNINFNNDDRQVFHHHHTQISNSEL